VSSTRELYERFRLLIHEGGKFLVVGLLGTIVTFAVAILLPHHGASDYLAITVATILATVVTFVGNRYWTFRHRQGQGTARDTGVFFVLNGVGLLIYYACLGIRDLAGLDDRIWYYVALVVGTGLGTLFRFWSYRKWVWVAAAQPPVLQGAPEPAEFLAEELAGAAEVVGRSPEREVIGQSPVPARRPAGSHRRT
jgi:putative flippase GtrA